MREARLADADIERRLRKLVPVDAPAPLRERVLSSARAARTHAALRPGLRVAVGTAALLVLTCLAIDPVMARRDAGQLEALLDGRKPRVPVAMATEMVDILAADAGVAERQLWLRNAVFTGLERDAGRARGESKGRLEYETLEDLY